MHRLLLLALLMLQTGCADRAETPAAVSAAAHKGDAAAPAPDAYRRYLQLALQKPPTGEAAIRERAVALRTALSDEVAVSWRQDVVKRIAAEPHSDKQAAFFGALAGFRADLSALRASSAAYRTLATGRIVTPKPVPPLAFDKVTWQRDYAAPAGQPLSLPEKMIASSRSGRDDASGDAPLKACLHRARLNIDQCNASARDGREAAYCIAEHGINEPGERCFGWVLPAL